MSDDKRYNLEVTIETATDTVKSYRDGVSSTDVIEARAFAHQIGQDKPGTTINLKVTEARD